MSLAHPTERPDRSTQAPISWTVCKLPERNNRTGEYVKNPGEQTRYWAGPVYSEADYPEAVKGQPIWGAPDGDTSTVESITIPADDVVGNFGIDYPPAHNSNDPVITRLQHGIDTAPNNGRVNPFENTAKLAGRVEIAALGKLATYNMGR
jgi:hypothetical protein